MISVVNQRLTLSVRSVMLHVAIAVVGAVALNNKWCCRPAVLQLTPQSNETNLFSTLVME